MPCSSFPLSTWTYLMNDVLQRIYVGLTTPLLHAITELANIEDFSY